MTPDVSPQGVVRVAAPIPAVAGIGLRFPHHDQVMIEKPDIGWFEVHPENYLGEGLAADTLEFIRASYPISLHATGLSLGSADGVDADHLASIVALCRRIEPGLVSDHLSWSGVGGTHLPDLLPLPYTEEALELVVRNIEQVQNAMKRSILIENPSVYLAFSNSEMSEGEFLAELVRRTGCGVLLDINNIAVSAANLDRSAASELNAMLDAIPPHAIGELHLAGHSICTMEDGTIIRIDDHGSPVSGDVWDLFDLATRRLGTRPSLMEWDTAIPDFQILAEEASTADAIMMHAGDAGGRIHAIAR